MVQVTYPTLGAFVDFISNFDMPEDSSTKLNGKGGIECGKSLSPVMFDPVLRSFNPNLPAGVSARPRFDACYNSRISMPDICVPTAWLDSRTVVYCYVETYCLVLA